MIRRLFTLLTSCAATTKLESVPNFATLIQMKKLRDTSHAVDTERVAPRPGRPPADFSDYVRAAVWAADVEHRAQMPLAAVEREFIRAMSPGRAAEMTRQPSAWTKYLRGERAPTLPGKHQSPVDWAEKRFPGSAATFESHLWRVLGASGTGPPVEKSDVFSRRLVCTSASTPNPFLPRDTNELIDIGELDAFAVLCDRGIGHSIYPLLFREMHAIRLWLCRWSNRLPAIQRARPMLLKGLYRRIPRLGRLESGAFALDDAISDEGQLAICLEVERRWRAHAFARCNANRGRMGLQPLSPDRHTRLSPEEDVRLLYPQKV